MRKHMIFSYVLITYLVTWTIWSISFTVPAVHGSFRIIGSFVPSIMSLIFISYYEGKENLKKLLIRVVTFKASPLIYSFIFSYSLITFFLPLFVCNLCGSNYHINFSDNVIQFSTHSVVQVLMCLAVIFILGGPLGEELGWRGFVLSRVQKKFNPFIAAIIVGVIWTLWHIPMFYFHAKGYENFLKYLFSTIYLSLIVTWLFNKTNGNLFIVILFHSIDDYINLACLKDLMYLFNTSIFYSLVYYAVLLMVLVFISVDMIRNPLKNHNTKVI